MKILFITIGPFKSIEQSGIYTDLLRMFKKNGHDVYVICSRERREGEFTEQYCEAGINVLRVRIGNITKVHFLEKGISTLLVGRKYYNAFEKFYKSIHFDCILYTTPPVTIISIVKKIKKKTGAFTYLMLKDIFPQNAVDLGIFNKHGITGFVYWYFRFIEKKLYEYSDMIGCMSPANVEYILKNNAEIQKNKVEVCPNTIDLIKIQKNLSKEIYEKFNIPQNKLLFIYGGNFGRPQNVDFIVKVLQKYNGHDSVHFIMCGSGTEYHKIEKESNFNQNVTCIRQLPYEEYIQLLNISHIGLIFLDERFTIPNFPSRILDYLNFQLPILLSTDTCTDIGKIVEENECGWWIKGNNEIDFFQKVCEIKEQYKKNDNYLQYKGENARKLLQRKFTTQNAFNIIIDSYYKGI